MFGGLNEKVSAVVFDSPTADDSIGIYVPNAAVITKVFAVADAALDQDGTNGFQLDFTDKGIDGGGATSIGSAGDGDSATADWTAFLAKSSAPTGGYEVAAGSVVDVAFNDFGAVTPGSITAGVVYVEGQL
jgi:hypothetical protein